MILLEMFYRKTRLYLFKEIYTFFRRKDGYFDRKVFFLGTLEYTIPNSLHYIGSNMYLNVLRTRYSIYEFEIS